MHLAATSIVVLLLVTLVIGQSFSSSHATALATATSIKPEHTKVYQDTLSDPSDDWPTYHRDALRSGYDPNILQFNSVTQHWKSTTLDGDVYAEPLVVGTAVVVATENNSLYELNATTGQTVWRTEFGTPVDASALGCPGDINPSGITSTPVVDTVSRTIFAVAFHQFTNGTLRHELFAIDLNTGVVKFEVPIDPQSANFPVNYQQQRAALALANGYVYVGYGGLDGDCGPYHGWIAATNENGAGPVISYQVPTGRAGGIWGGGDGPVVDSSGNLLVATGNSDATSTFDYGDAVLKLSPVSSGSISLLDYFAPSNWAALDSGDLDLGSTEPVALTSSYLFQIGKEGVGYELEATNLGHIGGQLYSAQVCNTSGGFNGAFGGLAYSPPYLVVPCSSGLVTLQVSPGSNPPFTIAWNGPSYETGPPIIAGNAVWDVDVSDGSLYVFSLTSGQTLFHQSIGSLPTHFNSLSAGDGQIFVTADREVMAYQPQQASMTLVTTVSGGTGSVSPNCPGGCNEVIGSSVSVTATAASGYIFSSWTMTGASCSGGSSSNPCQFTMPNNQVTASATFIQQTSITLLVSPSSVTIGSFVTFTGSISPNPGAVPVTVILSRDSGTTYNPIISVMTNSSGAYSTHWTPSNPGNYLLEASWNGNDQLAPSQSSPESLTVIGSVPPSTTVLISAPSTVPHTQLVTLSVIVFNPTNSAFSANVTIQIVGPNNYAAFDTIHVQVAADSHSTGYYDWTAPNQTGTYTVTVGLLPPAPSAVDVETIQVT